jgi:hypothetical protein
MYVYVYIYSLSADKYVLLNAIYHFVDA